MSLSTVGWFESIDRIVGEDPNPVIKEQKVKCRKNCKLRQFAHDHWLSTHKDGTIDSFLMFSCDRKTYE